MSSKRAIPTFEKSIIETHCHLDYLEEADLQSELALAKQHNIEKIITIAVSKDNLDTVKQLATNNEQIYFTQGIHPHDAEGYDQSVADKILTNSKDAKCLAVGEIGLDYFYDHADRSKQKQAFIEQLQIAQEIKKPVVIHSREADVDTTEILKQYTPDHTGVIHSFTSGLELAKFCLDKGFYLGFNGIITFKNAQNVRDALAITPLDRILLETDAPYLTPVPYRGKPNAPKYLPFIAEKVAEVKNVDIETVLNQCYLNSQRCFFEPNGL